MCPTDLKPECVIFSVQNSIEMTVPVDINIEKGHSAKLEKYQAGIQQQADREWSTYVFPIEVGARGYVNKRVHG